MPVGQRASAVLLCALWLSACGKAEQELTVEDGWVRFGPPNSMMTAGYGTLANTGSKPLVLSGFTSPLFGDVTLHVTEDQNGTATMREARNVRLEPGDTLTLEPGGYHLMLMQRKQPTPEGSDVVVSFSLESGTTTEHRFKVERR